jgi:hypothetical protein
LIHFFSLSRIDHRELSLPKERLIIDPFHHLHHPSQLVALLTTRTTLDKWHSCRGHASINLINQIVSRNNLHVTSNKAIIMCYLSTWQKSSSVFSFIYFFFKKPSTFIVHRCVRPFPLYFNQRQYILLKYHRWLL